MRLDRRLIVSHLRDYGEQAWCLESRCQRDNSTLLFRKLPPTTNVYKFKRKKKIKKKNKKKNKKEKTCKGESRIFIKSWWWPSVGIEQMQKINLLL